MSHKVASTAVTLLAAVSLAGCAQTTSGSSSGASSHQSGGPQTVVVGALPNTGDAALQVGIDKGYFAKQGITLKLKFAQGFQANLAAVLNGSEQVGFSSSVPLLVAASKRAPVTVVANAEYTPTNPKEDHVAVIARPGEHLTGPKSLDGKTVAVVALGNSDSIALREAVSKAGGNPKSMKLIQLGFSDQLPALKAKRVDAIVIGEPFRTQALQAGMTEVFPDLATGIPGLPQSAYFVSAQFIKKNPQLVNKFAKAMNQSTDYAAKHPDELRKVLPKFANIDAKLAQKIRLGDISSKMSAQGYQKLAILTKKYGLLTTPPDMSTFLYKG